MIRTSSASTAAVWAASTMQETYGGKLTSDDINIYFGPNERRIGKQFEGDPTVDEAALKLADFSVLGWIER